MKERPGIAAPSPLKKGSPRRRQTFAEWVAEAVAVSSPLKEKGSKEELQRKAFERRAWKKKPYKDPLAVARAGFFQFEFSDLHFGGVVG
jgi:hypothetical protein